MPMQQSISDDMEKPHFERPISDTIIEDKDAIREQTAEEPAEVPPSDKPSISSLPSIEAEEVSSEVEEVSSEAEEVSSEAEEVSSEAEEVSSEAEEVSSEAKEVSSEAKEVSSEAKEVSSEAEEVSSEAKEVSSNPSDKHEDDEQSHQNDETSDLEKTLIVPKYPHRDRSKGENLTPPVLSDVSDSDQTMPAHRLSSSTDSALDELVPLTPEAEYLPTQQLTSNGIDKPVGRSRSRTLQTGHTNSRMQAIGALVPLLPTVPSVRTPATLHILKAQRHRKLLLRYLSRKHMRQGRTEVQRASHRFWTFIFTMVAVVMILFVGVAGGGAYAAYNFYSQTENQYANQIHSLRDLMPGDNLKMYDRNGILIGQDMQGGMKTEEPLSQISPSLIKATVDTEDKGFWTNPGVDVSRILQAAIDDLHSNRVVAGGSTITQQLIKNLILSRDQNFQRKLQELALVPDINNRYSKRDILEMYLNSCNYGEMTYGPEAAATYYFGLEDQANKSAAAQMDLAQAATLAGIPNSPTLYDPLQHPQDAFGRLQVVLDAMLNNRDITKVEEIDALTEAQQPGFFKVSSPSFVNRAPHFYYFILDQLKKQFNMDDEQIARSDMKVYTTLDINLQDQIQKIAQNQIAALAGLNVTNAAEVLIDFHTGAIISMLGSIDYNSTVIDGKYNVALGYRQAGSSFKPYVYVAAFSRGVSPGQGIADEPLSISVQGEVYTPLDADGKYHGQMTIRCALQNSFNIPAVRALQYVGIDNAMQMAQNMGIESYTGTPGYSLVLGGLGIRLLDHTSAFGTFANGGVRVPYYGVEKIVFASSSRVEQHKADPGTRILSPQLAYMMTNVLTDNTARTPEFTKCSVLYLYSNSQNQCYAGNPGVIRPAAAKTGTTNDFRDNLTMGYTTDYVMGVWSGNNNNSPMKVVFGVQGAAPIWHDAMLLAEQGHPIRDFTNPGGLQTATVTYPDGVHSTDLYLQGQNPNAAANDPANQTLAPRGSGGYGAHYCPSS